MKKTILAAAGLLGLAALYAAPTLAQSGTPWLHVRVEEKKDTTKVSVNIPLSVVEAVLKASPEFFEKHGKIKIGHDHGFKKVMRKGDLVQVFVDQKPRPGKDGEKGKGAETVRVEVPTSLVDAFLSGEGEEGNIEAAILELRKRRGDIVHVRVWIDEQNTQVASAGK